MVTIIVRYVGAGFALDAQLTEDWHSTPAENIFDMQNMFAEEPARAHGASLEGAWHMMPGDQASTTSSMQSVPLGANS